ncbi:MAG: hypothetical protein BSOLF_0430 [Candidatus Carbobacillus altaicus]|uniref:Uncharacterized protein n=1 Tax=Candidatus Carbonibacillus altaicus TaxID=2163959 RepID=A0A2R6Y5H9_9BACL|nr:MAG: hypothetical protein BSOLF_0430 [Candidatus Carbobacillus altaicus]
MFVPDANRGSATPSVPVFMRFNTGRRGMIVLTAVKGAHLSSE